MPKTPASKSIQFIPPNAPQTTPNRPPNLHLPYPRSPRNLPRRFPHQDLRLLPQTRQKASGIQSVTAQEAVETALCFGWIDGRANTLDNNWWLIRYTPRRAKSIWSQKNVATVARLVSAGRMRPAGLAAVDAAKADGRWERAYAGPAGMSVPDDFRGALKRVHGAEDVFEGLKKSQRYAVLWRVETASPRARMGRIEALVKMLAEGKVPGDPTASVLEGKRKSKGEIEIEEGDKEVSTRRKSARVAAKSK